MAWKDIAKLASSWADAKKTELLTADRRTRADASAQAEAVEVRAQEEAATSFLEAALPQPWADRVTAARPENVAARQAEADRQEDVRRRARLSGQGTAEVTLSFSGGEVGSGSAVLPCTREEAHPAPDPDALDDGPPPLSWLRVLVEAPDPVLVGGVPVGSLGVAVPAYAGPGTYDLVDLAERGERGEIGWWEVFDIHLNPTNEADDRIWYLDVSAEGGAIVDVSESAVTFDLPMASALSSIRLRGAITW
ncbi:hypothetical protein HNR19_004361 [Nocardioides thalensis]|uniref:Uncharacterized protein n=1 Tax=Nocardioides thalensis TaxID=1914755 RepID=A0A853CBW3_9ACTN|nr:hypothetical protein [Nocardioides thalensis]NYJ03663.1 hypothetical protein [Nocardioides thalensis]